MILVTGATGGVGRQVVAQLVDAGQPVRALTRRPQAARLPAGVEVVAGDLTRPETLAPALSGVDTAFLFPVAATAAETVAQLTAAGVSRVVVLSSAAVPSYEGAPTDPAAMDDPIAASHRRVEVAVQRSELAWTFLRPGAFARNTLRWAPQIRATGVVTGPYPQATAAPIDERDIAAVAVAALLDAGHASSTYVLGGPESLTQAEQADQIGAAIGRPVRFQQVPVEQARAAMVAQVPEVVVDALLRMQAASVGRPAPVGAVVEAVTGRRARTFAQWAADNADAFR